MFTPLQHTFYRQQSFASVCLSNYHTETFMLLHNLNILIYTPMNDLLLLFYKHDTKNIFC
jgi:hypothetical protein